MKLFILMFCMILLVGSTSAFSINDLDDIKPYNEELKTYSLENFFGFGKHIADLELKTPQEVFVPMGYQKVAEVEIRNGEYDYNEIINGIELLNIKDDMKEVIRDVDYKYKTIIQVPDYKTLCDKGLSFNGSEISINCRQEQIGLKDEIVWEDFEKNSLLKGENITLGIFTDVKLGDHIEWIINVYGNERLTAWAIFSASIDVGLVSSYPTNESSGTTIQDFKGSNDGVTNNMEDGDWSGSSLEFDGVNEFANLTGLATSLNGIDEMSIAFNFTPRDLAGGIGVIASDPYDVSFRANWQYRFSSATVLQFYSEIDAGKGICNTGFKDIDGGMTFVNGQSYTLVGVINTSGVYTWIDGDFKGKLTCSSTGTYFNAFRQPFVAFTTGGSFLNGGVGNLNFWNRSLTTEEAIVVTSIINGSFTDAPTITLNSPIDNFNSSIQTINFNGGVIGATDVQNVSLFIDGVLNETNSSGINNTDYLFTKILLDGDHNWTYESCSDTGCNIATSRNLSVDSIIPNVNVTFPIGILDFQEINTNLFLNWNVSDSSLDSCFYDYNGTNITVTCLDNQTNINITGGSNKNLTFYVNDTVGNLNSSFTSWEYKIFISNKTFNTSSFETKAETFSINVTANSSLTEVVLDYNGTNHSTTQSGTTYSTTFDIPIGVSNNSVKWDFTYAGDTIESTEYNQNISLTNFSICDGSLTDDFLNISFKDEDDLSVLNASIPTSNFLYYLGSGLINKTYSFSSITNNYNYTFCATPDETLNVDAFVQYKQGTDYPQRIYDPEVRQYTSTVTNQILYLLNSLDGIFVTFQVINSIEQGISGVKITGTRDISGEDVEVASGTTDAAGSVTFWLNPDFSHTFTFVKTGFETVSTSLFPTQPSYTITLTGGEGTGAFDYSRGIAISTRPIGAVLNDTLYNFNYTISSSFWVLEEFGFTLSYSNGTTIGTQTSTANTGGTVGLDATTGNNGSIIMEYYYLINSTYINATSTWYIFKSNEYSIQHLLERVVTYIDADMLGVQSDDEGYFFKAVFSVLILISVTGILSTRYGLASEQAVSGIIFGVLLLLNNFNLIPTPPGTTFANLGNFLVALVGFMLVVSIFREESR